MQFSFLYKFTVRRACACQPTSTLAMGKSFFTFAIECPVTRPHLQPREDSQNMQDNYFPCFVCIYGSLKFHRRSNLEYPEFLWIKVISADGRNFLIGNYYFPPMFDRNVFCQHIATSSNTILTFQNFTGTCMAILISRV